MGGPGRRRSGSRLPLSSRSVRRAWERNAVHWDARMADGNLTQRLLVGPATACLLQPRAGERVLDLACGNGVASRWLASCGAEVLAVDFSSRLLKLARRRGNPGPGKIRYARVDLTRASELRRLGPRPFDAAVCNMALMDVSTLAPLARALPTLLAEDGRFVLSVCHPCFNNTTTERFLEQREQDGEVQTRLGIRVFDYRTPQPRLGIAMLGQPLPQYYFDRSLTDLLGPFLRRGWCLDGVEEPAYPAPVPGVAPTSWGAFTEIPQVLVLRLRPRRRPAGAAAPARGTARVPARPGRRRGSTR